MKVWKRESIAKYDSKILWSTNIHIYIYVDMRCGGNNSTEICLIYILLTHGSEKDELAIVVWQ